jgi:anti-sigma-K factor RskA
MSDERHISEIEELLREIGPPPTPPEHLHAVARDAALSGGEVIALAPRVRPRGRAGRLVLAAAVLTASAAAALVIGVGGNAAQIERTIHMQGVGSASAATAQVDFASSGGRPVREMVLHVDGLPPAPTNGYYELWMQHGNGDPVGLLAFDTPQSGHVVIHSSMPSGLSWTKCWVTVERPNGTDVPVMRLA